MFSSIMDGQTHPTFHPTLVFSMLDEMLDAFDRGLIEECQNDQYKRNAQLFKIYKMVASRSL